MSALQTLQNSLNSVKAPTITPQVKEPNFANFFGAIDKAEARTLKIKTEIDQSSFGAGFSNFLSSEKGKFANVGRELGQTLTMGMQQQFGVAGGVLGEFASTLGPLGIAVGVAGTALIGLGAASVSAAKSWESMKTSIGRTTGLEGGNLESLMNDLQDLRQEMGITAEAAAGLVEQAGSIGVGQAKMASGDIAGYQKEITDFAKTTAILQGAWGMSAEATSSGIGKMGSVTLGAWNMQRKAVGEAEMSWSEYANTVGGKVDALANTMGSSEEEIVTAMRNSSAAVASYAPSEETYSKWLSLSSFLIDTGSSAGEAGTQIERLAKGAKQHGAELGAILGMDEGGFSESLNKDFVGTFQNIATELATMPESERPDMIKLLGIEGSGAMDKMIADVKSGVNKLNTAIKLDPTNVTEGWDKVADDAGKSFDRITQAATVSLEKIGGLIMPVVTSIANWGADALESVNTAGTEIYGAVEKVATGGLDFSMNGEEYNLDWSGVHKKVAEEVTAGANEGAEAAAPKVADALTTDLEKSTKEAVGAGFLAAAKDSKISSALASVVFDSTGTRQMTDEQGFSILSSQSDTSKSIRAAGDALSFGTILSGYTAQKYMGEAISSSGMYKIWDEAGELVAENVLDLGKWKAEMQPIVQDFEKYFRKASSDIKDNLAEAIEDGVIEPLEKTSIEGLISQLEELKSYDLEIYTRLDGESLRNDAINALANLPMSIDKSELELAFSKYIAENSSMYETIYQKTGIISYEDQERTLHNALKAAPEEAQSLYAELESAIKSGDLSSLSTIPAIMDEIADVSPELLVFAGTTNRLAAAQELYLDAWANARQGTSEASANGDFANGYFLRTSQAEEISKVGLVSMAKDVYNSAVRMREANLYAAKGGELLFSPLTETFANAGAKVEALDEILPTTTDSAATLSAAFVDTTSNVSLANEAVSKFSAALGAATFSMASRSYSSAYYSPAATSTTTLASSLNQNAKYSFLPLEYQLAYSKNIPKFATGAKVYGKTLAWIAESGETEYVIPESKIKGLYPEFAKATEGSMQWLTGEKYFSDYASPTITPPTSYRWSSYPDAPQVQQLNTDKMPSAWLSEGQTSGADMISSEIRALQLASIGKSQVIPWFARGEMEQPDWWVDAATKLSPKYAANWGESKGGSVPEIVSDTPKISTKTSTVSDYWNGIYDNSGTCIAFVEPDPSLKFTPGTASKTALNRDAWNAVYDNEGTCIAFVEPDASLKFTPSQSSLEEAARGAWGSQAVSSNIRAIRDNTNDNKKATEGLLASVDKASLQNAVAGVSNVQKTISVTADQSGALVGLSKEGYVVSYDPRTDTCEGLAFNPPDPSLLTTDLFYTGPRAGNLPNESYDEGYGWGGKVAEFDYMKATPAQISEYESWKQSSQTGKTTTGKSSDAMTRISDYAKSIDSTVVRAYQQDDAIYATLQDEEGNTKTIATKISNVDDNIAAMANYQTGGELVSGIYAAFSAGSGALNSSGTFGGSYGSNFGGWYTGGAAGLSARLGTGSASTWMNAAATSIGGSNAIQWAEGGITDHPVFGVFGEAGREAFVPISDRQAGLRILPKVMKELGVRQFAAGGIVGSGGGLQNLSAAIGPTDVTYAPVINLAGMSEAAIQRIIEKERKKVLADVAKAQTIARRHRS